ncbi:MAG: hypothetical protein AAGI15_16315 [Pseudomonadota bacterium]
MSSPTRPAFFTLVAALCLIMAIGVFAVRFLHAGTYSMPGGGAVYGALGCLVIAGVLLFAWRTRPLAWIAVLATPIALFPTLYSIMAESEEVISLYATDASGAPAELRLWIADEGGSPWLGMPRSKATEHSLDGNTFDMLRAGSVSCVKPVLFDEDRETVRRIHGLKVKKYRVARIAGAIGMYPLEAPDTTVVLRLDPCAGDA